MQTYAITPNPLWKGFPPINRALLSWTALFALFCSATGQAAENWLMPMTFTNAPPVTEWSRASAPGSSSTFIDAAALDAAIQTNSAIGIASALGSTSVLPPAVGGQALWNSAGQLLQTRPGGNAYTMLLGKFRNDAMPGWNVVTISYDFGVWASAGAEIEESIPGHRVYWSLSGEPNSWNLIPELSGLSSSNHVSVTISCDFFWDYGATLYLLWVDDNGPADSTAPLCEGGYTIDNFSMGPALAESGCWVFAPSTVIEHMPVRVHVIAGVPCADIARLDLYVDNQLYVSSNSYVADFMVTNLALGQHWMYAIATDTRGHDIFGFPVQVNVVGNTLQLVPLQARFGTETNGFAFKTDSPAGQRVVLEASPDLQGWTAVATNYIGSPTVIWSDAMGVTNSRRFYRARFVLQ